MREVRVTVSPQAQSTVLEVLDEHEIHYEIHEEVVDAEGETIVSIVFYIPAASTQFVTEQIRSSIDDQQPLSIILQETSSVIGKEHTHQRIKRQTGKNKIAREELLQRAQELQPELRSYLTLSVLSVIIAIFGLLLDSTAVVIGAVVLAPLMGPALAAGVGTVVDNQEMFRRGIYMQSLGIVVVVVFGAGFAYILRWFTPLTPDQVLGIGEVSQNVAPNILALGLAFGSGIAGAYSLSFKSPSSLIGVAMAAAILPPLGVTSIGIAWEMPAVALGAFIFALLNILVINMIAIPVFWSRGYSPNELFEEGFSLSERGWKLLDLRTYWSSEAWFRRVSVMLVLIMIVSSFVGFVTIGQWENSQVEQEIREDIEEIHDQPQYQALEIVDIEVEYDQSLPVPNVKQVRTTISYTPQTDEAIANDFLIRISALIEHRYDVQVIMSEQRAISD